MPELDTHQTQWLLEQWARWARVNPDYRLGYPAVTPFRRLLGSTVPASLLSDDEALFVDSMVGKLQQRHPGLGQAVFLYYMGSCNLSQVARKLKINRKRAEVLVKSGTAWLDAAMSVSRAA